MSRRASGGASAARAPEGWPVEWTCAGAAALVCLLLSQVSHIAPSLFVGHCTSLSGMCTPAQCTCPDNLRKRELVTQDTQACFQCVPDFCPAVAEGDGDCSTEPCECEDPSWTRHEIMIDGKLCSQCQRPPVDFTVRGDSGEGSCLALAPAQVGEAGDAQGATVPLVSTRNQSECLPMRYNGARIREKRVGGGCLTWSSFGARWVLGECDRDNQRMQFDQLQLSPEADPPETEVYCTGRNSSEFCVQVEVTFCTEEDGRCSTERCRCEDLSWSRVELQTINGSQCFICTPPAVHCTTSQDTCTPGPCECANPMHVPLLASENESAAGGVHVGAPCLRCGPPSGASGSTDSPSMVSFSLFVVVGLVGGCLVRKLRGDSSPSSRGRARRQAEGARPWSERWAEELEDALEGLYSLLVETPAELLRWTRPYLRHVGRFLGNAVDFCDAALDPLYMLVDTVQAAGWDWIEIQHERLVWGSSWLWDFCADLPRLASGSWSMLQGDGCSRPAGGKALRMKRKAGSKAVDGALDAATEELEEKAATRSTKGESQATIRQRAARKAESEGQKPKPAKDQPRPGARAAGSPIAAAATAASSSSAVPEASASCESFEWDPLGMGSEPGVETSAAAQPVAIPEQYLRQLATAHSLQQQQQPQQQPRSAPLAGGTGPATPAQSRAQRKLQQRREALAQREAAASPTIAVEEAAQLDESWIDELEKEAKAGASKTPKSSKKKKGKDPSARLSPAAVAGTSMEEEAAQGTAVETPPMAEAAEPAEQAQVADKTEEDAVGTDQHTESVVQARDVSTQATLENIMDTDSLLGEVVHGLYQLLSSEQTGHADAAVQSCEVKDSSKVADEEKSAAVGPEQDPLKKETGWDEARRPGKRGRKAAAAQQEAQDPQQPHPQQPLQQQPPQQQQQKRLPQQQQPQPQQQQPQQQPQQQSQRPSQPLAQPSRQKPQQPSSQQAAPTPSQPSQPSRRPTEKPAQRPATWSALLRQRTPPSDDPARAAPQTPLAPEPAAPQPVRVGQDPEEQPAQPEAQRRTEEAEGGAAEPEPSTLSVQALEAEAPTGTEVSEAAATEQVASAPAAADPAPVKAAPKPRAWASLFRRQTTPEAQVAARPAAGSSLGGADATEFVPSSMLAHQPSEAGKKQGKKKGGRAKTRQQDGQLAFSDMVTTVSVSDLAPAMDADGFIAQMESWGMAGTFDFLLLPIDKVTGQRAGYAIVNFVDASFVLLFCWIYRECGFSGVVASAEIQGYEANRAHWAQVGSGEEGEPVLLPKATPSQECVNVVNMMLAPQCIREQFHKTKLCVFHKKNRCEMGASCPFAHTEEELQPSPDLAKTKLCYNYFRQKCSDPRCKFAHGSAELRSVWVPYSPGNWEQTTFGEEGMMDGVQAGAFGGQELPMGACEMPYPLILGADGAMHVAPESIHMQDRSSSSGQVDEERSDGGDASSLGFSRGISQDDRYAARATGTSTGWQWQRSAREAVPVRVRGTFLEAVQPQSQEEVQVIKRSWSEGDLHALRRGMAEVDL